MRRVMILLMSLLALVSISLFWGCGGGDAPVPTDGIVTRLNPTDGAEMVWVAGGTFIMGTEYATWWDAPYTQQATVTGYWIYTYEVSVAQYRVFCAATGRALPAWPGNVFSWTGKSGWDDPRVQQHPIVNVTWHDAKAYADWAGVTLPTEAQWEYAARGPQQRNYPWGGTASFDDAFNGWDTAKCAEYATSYSQGISTWPVGSFPAGVSWCGAQDMAGNVWEWCADWYAPYAATPVTNPAGPATGAYRVQHGGSWYGDDGGGTRGAYRYYNLPGQVWYSNGFRCATPTAP
jgi:formylglycine-generating enzyme required for sulfatase activity